MNHLSTPNGKPIRREVNRGTSKCTKKNLMDRNTQDISLSPLQPADGYAGWKNYERILFRMGFIFFLLMCIPVEPWYTNFFAIDWTNLHYRDLYVTGRFLPKYIDTQHLSWMRGYQTMALIALIAVAGGGIWTLLDRRRKQYTVLYYWLRTLVRYRAAIYMIVWGLIKIFPVQCPYPSEGILNTSLGDLPIQKIYWWSVGSVPLYEVFAGLVEFGAGILLFFRRTAPLGAALMLGTLAVLTSANISYGGGVHIESTFFVMAGIFLLLSHVRDVYRLLILQLYTVPRKYHPVLSNGIRYSLLGLKSLLFFVFVVVMSYLSYLNFRYDPYNQAITASPPELRGVYEVRTFKLNGEELPYSPFDSARWQDVTFEKWTSMTFKVFQPIDFDRSTSIGFGFNSGAPMRDIDRNLESFTGDIRRAFHYYLDSVNHVLYLEDKSPGAFRQPIFISDSLRQYSSLYSDQWISPESWININDEYTKINPRKHFTRRYRGYQKEYPSDKNRNRMELKYQILDTDRVLLTGLNETGDSLHVLLERRRPDYVLPAPALVAGSYE